MQQDNFIDAEKVIWNQEGAGTGGVAVQSLPEEAQSPEEKHAVMALGRELPGQPPIGGTGAFISDGELDKVIKRAATVLAGDLDCVKGDIGYVTVDCSKCGEPLEHPEHGGHMLLPARQWAGLLPEHEWSLEDGKPLCEECTAKARDGAARDRHVEDGG